MKQTCVLYPNAQVTDILAVTFTGLELASATLQEGQQLCLMSTGFECFSIPLYIAAN